MVVVSFFPKVHDFISTEKVARFSVTGIAEQDSSSVTELWMTTKACLPLMHPQGLVCHCGGSQVLYLGKSVGFFPPSPGSLQSTLIYHECHSIGGGFQIHSI